MEKTTGLPETTNVSSSFCLHMVHIISFSMPFAKAGHMAKAYNGMEKCSPLKCHCKLDGNGWGRDALYFYNEEMSK